MSVVVPIPLSASQRRKLLNGQSIQISGSGMHSHHARVHHVVLDSRTHKGLARAAIRGRGKRIFGRLAEHEHLGPRCACGGSVGGSCSCGGDIWGDIGNSFKSAGNTISRGVTDIANRTRHGTENFVRRAIPVANRLGGVTLRGLKTAHEFAKNNPVLRKIIKEGGPALAGAAAGAAATYLTGNPEAGNMANQAASKGASYGLSEAGYGFTQIGRGLHRRGGRSGPALLSGGTDQNSGRFLTRTSGGRPDFKYNLPGERGRGFTPIG